MRKSMIILSQRLIVIMLGTTLFACGNKQAGHQAGVPEYAVVTIEPSVSKLNNSYPATIKGCQDVEIRPNVSGFITKLCVDEGSVVKKGQTLFVIDPVQYEEAVNVARKQGSRQPLLPQRIKKCWRRKTLSANTNYKRQRTLWLNKRLI